MPAIPTGCQGYCKHRHVLSVRIGARREMFGRLASDEDRRSLFEYAKKAHQLGSFLVPNSGVEPFRFDLEHGCFEPAARLRPVRFLTGRFRGLGRYADGSYTFSKEVVGAYEPGGQFMTLRMGARYPTSDGGSDVHRALVVVGSASHGHDKLTGRAFTDGADVHDYDVDCCDTCLEFDDQSPDHGTPWTHVRKTLRPTPEGYDESLHVDRGRGLEPYYRIAMHRAAAPAAL